MIPPRIGRRLGRRHVLIVALRNLKAEHPDGGQEFPREMREAADKLSDAVLR